MQQILKLLTMDTLQFIQIIALFTKLLESP
jgi:hypothetical protein